MLGSQLAHPYAVNNTAVSSHLIRRPSSQRPSRFSPLFDVYQPRPCCFPLTWWRCTSQYTPERRHILLQTPSTPRNDGQDRGREICWRRNEFATSQKPPSWPTSQNYAPYERAVPTCVPFRSAEQAASRIMRTRDVNVRTMEPQQSTHGSSRVFTSVGPLGCKKHARTHWPSYLRPSGQLKIPRPCLLSLQYSPSYLRPSIHANVPARGTRTAIQRSRCCK